MQHLSFWCSAMQVFNATSAPVAATPNLTLLVPEGTVKIPTASSSSNAANTTAAQQPTARQFEVQLNFTLQPPGSSAGTSPSPSPSPGTSPAPVATPESTVNVAPAVIVNNSSDSNAAAGNAAAVALNAAGSNAAAGNAAAGHTAAGSAATNAGINTAAGNAAAGNAAAGNAAAGNAAAGNAAASPAGTGNAAADSAGGSNLARKLQQQQQKQQTPAQQPGEFTVGLRILTGNLTYTDVYLRGLLVQPPAADAAAADGAAAAIGNLSVWVDRTHAGNASNTTWIEGGPVPLPVNASDAWLVPQQPLGLSVFVDHSVVEVYALGGLARVSSRIYPEGDDVAWGLAVWSNPPSLAVNGSGGSGGGAWDVVMDATVWEMQNAWLPPNC
jgi:hypothetical protein